MGVRSEKLDFWDFLIKYVQKKKFHQKFMFNRWFTPEFIMKNWWNGVNYEENHVKFHILSMIHLWNSLKVVSWVSEMTLKFMNHHWVSLMIHYENLWIASNVMFHRWFIYEFTMNSGKFDELWQKLMNHHWNSPKVHFEVQKSHQKKKRSKWISHDWPMRI